MWKLFRHFLTTGISSWLVCVCVFCHGEKISKSLQESKPIINLISCKKYTSVYFTWYQSLAFWILLLHAFSWQCIMPWCKAMTKSAVAESWKVGSWTGEKRGGPCSRKMRLQSCVNPEVDTGLCGVILESDQIIFMLKLTHYDHMHHYNRRQKFEFHPTQ